MFNGKEKWLVYLCLMLALAINAILIIKQLQYTYNLRMMYLTGERTNLPVPTHQQVMLINEAFSKTFFLIFFCFWMILFGTLIFFTQSERVYRSERADEVKLLWKATAPGIAMIAVGAIILAYSISRYSNTRLQLASNDQDRSHEYIMEKKLPAPPDTIIQEPVKPKPQHNPVVHKHKQPVKTIVVKKVEKEEEPQKEYNISPKDVNWANQLATRTLKYGYYPTRGDNKRYEQISNSLERTGDTDVLSDDKSWSLQLIRKMQQGYQPTEAEMQRLDLTNDALASTAGQHRTR